MNLCCDNCNSEEFYSLVSYGSYYLLCSACLTPGPATSFMAVKEVLEGLFEIIEVDSQMNELQLLAAGDIQNHIDIISKEADAGKIIWLKSV
jgi:hypothetical protein